MNNVLDLAMNRMFNITLETDNYLVKWAADAIAYYINSGRAPTAWIKAFSHCNTRKLLEYAAAGHDGSDMGLMARVNTYIRKHHHID